MDVFRKDRSGNTYILTRFLKIRQEKIEILPFFCKLTKETFAFLYNLSKNHVGSGKKPANPKKHEKTAAPGEAKSGNRENSPAIDRKCKKAYNTP